ncbi:paramyosin, short form-like [Cylas formicarius]|uniref:paramyosin, short form-like n=1 Tax=Cylas formicarius TaxID=197179 RepID=UPI0029588401|nr:paramyosin, short form-like [Cylas formicarius]
MYRPINKYPGAYKNRSIRRSNVSLSIKTTTQTRKMPRPDSKSKWQPKTQCYEYNYGTGMNFYQPMVDYIEEKRPGTKIRFPHLPWSAELDPSSATRSYSEQELTRVSRKTEASAQRTLRKSRSHASSAFLLAETASAARITTKIKTEQRKKKALVREIKKLQGQMKDEIEYDPEHDKVIERELMAQQKFLRGKSAKSIEAQLLAGSRKVIAEAVELDSRKSEVACISRTTHGRHFELMDERMQAKLERSFAEPLEDLSRDLRGFDRKTTHYFIDQR